MLTLLNIRLKSLRTPLLCVALSVSLAAGADQPPEKNGVHAVMYALVYDAQSFEITHAQVIGGYPSLNVCRKAMTSVLAASSSQLKSNERLRLDCSGGRPVEPARVPRSPGA